MSLGFEVDETYVICGKLVRLEVAMDLVVVRELQFDRADIARKGLNHATDTSLGQQSVQH